MTNDETRLSAEKDYQSGMKYQEIADKYKVSINTVKSWKTRHKWAKPTESDGVDAPTEKKVHTNTKRVHTKSEKGAHKIEPDSHLEQAIDEMTENGLTVKQNAFIIEYLRTYNQTLSYMNVYKVDYNTANKLASRMMVNDGIQAEIKRLQKEALKGAGVTVEKLVQDIAKEATADIRDFVNWGSYNETQYEYEKNKNGAKKRDKSGEFIIKGERLDDDGNPIVTRKSWLQFKNPDEMDTTAVKSIKMGKDGPSLELHDRNKAREKLLDILSAEKGGVVDPFADMTIAQKREYLDALGGYAHG